MIDKLSLFFSNPLLAEMNFAVMDSKFRTIWSQHQNPLLKLHLSIAAENFLKFVKPNVGEAFWSNSPQVGSLSENSHFFFSQIFSVNQEPFYVVFEYPFFGLKPFPPVLLDLSAETMAQDSTLKEITAHCSHGLQNATSVAEKLKSIRQDISKFVEKCLKAEKAFKIFSLREETFLQQKHLIKQKFKDNPVSSVQRQISIEGTLVKLNLVVSEDQIVFDFSETQMKRTWGWPEAMTNSICYFLASHCFPIQTANHSSFSFLKLIHSRQSPLAAKDYCEVKQAKALCEFFDFVKKSMESISHRFVFSKEIQIDLLADKQIELLLANESLKIVVPSKMKNGRGKIALYHRSHWKPFADLKHLCPAVKISLNQKILRLSTPSNVQVLGWSHPGFAQIEKTEKLNHIDLNIC